MLSRRAATTAVLLGVGLPLGATMVQSAGAQAPPSPTPTVPITVAPPGSPRPTVHQVDIKATTRVSRQGSVYVGLGRFTGKPFTRGDFKTRTQVISRTPLRIHTRVTITTRVGQVILTLVASGSGSILYGGAKVVGGTDLYAGITGSNLHVSITGGAKETIRVKGKVKYVNTMRGHAIPR